jgi:hypothetical protein
MDYKWAIAICLGIFIASLIKLAFEAADKNNRKSLFDSTLKNDNEELTLPKEKYYQVDGRRGIAYIEEKNDLQIIMFGFVSFSEDRVKTLHYSYKDIISSEIIEDGNVTTKSTSVISRAIVGGILLGGVGAIVGGLTGKKESITSIKSIQLRIIVNDTEHPVHELTFLSTETKKDNTIYQDAIKSANHWQALLDILIKKADHEMKATPETRIFQDTQFVQEIEKTKDSTNTYGIADELKKLAELQKDGFITMAEFQQQKEKLLG